MTPKNQLTTLLEKYLNFERDAGEMSLLLQILQVRPRVVLSDGLARVTCASDRVLELLANEEVDLTLSNLLNGLVIVKGARVAVEPGEARGMEVEVMAARLLVPGIRMERWGSPVEMWAALEGPKAALLARLLRAKQPAKCTDITLLLDFRSQVKALSVASLPNLAKHVSAPAASSHGADAPLHHAGGEMEERAPHLPGARAAERTAYSLDAQRFLSVGVQREEHDREFIRRENARRLCPASPPAECKQLRKVNA